MDGDSVNCRTSWTQHGGGCGGNGGANPHPNLRLEYRTL